VPQLGNERLFDIGEKGLKVVVFPMARRHSVRPGERCPPPFKSCRKLASYGQDSPCTPGRSGLRFSVENVASWLLLSISVDAPNNLDVCAGCHGIDQIVICQAEYLRCSGNIGMKGSATVFGLGRLGVGNLFV
jgi:hypothetical protein